MASASAGNGSTHASVESASGGGLAPEVYTAIRCVDAPRVHREVGRIGPEVSLHEAVNRMWWRQRGTIAVTEGDALVGSLSEDDLLRVVEQALRREQKNAHPTSASLLVWDELLRDLRVADAMSTIDEIAVVHDSATLHEGIQQTFEIKPSGARRRYVFVVDEAQRLVRVVSMRDVCRYLICVYDGGEAAAELPVIDAARVRRVVRDALDLSVGMIRSGQAFGHAPVGASIEDTGAAVLEKMWEGQRGYVLVSFFDGAPQGICTRRDLLRVLRRPFSRLRDLAVANLMSAQVKAASRLITLGGVFKLMAIGGYRHLPLLEANGQVECVISMWEGAALLASPAARPLPVSRAGYATQK